MRKSVYIILVFLSSCANYKAPLGGAPQQQETAGKRIAAIMDAGLSAQPQYGQALLQRRQIEFMKLENERMALQNELMRRELYQYQNRG